MKNYLIILFSLFSYSLYSQPIQVVFSDELRGANDWGDYNNDGYLDFMKIGRTGQIPNQYLKAALYINNYGGYFYEYPNLQFIAIDETNRKGSIKWIDYNNDNILDLFISGDTDITYNTTPISKLYKNNGNSTFSEIVLPFANKAGGAGWADFDNDGDFDLILLGDTTIIYFNDGNESFIAYTDSVINKIANESFALGDFNNDGFIDMIGESKVDYKIKLYKNIGDGSFIEISDNNFPLIEGSIDLGDYDNDGDLDIILSGSIIEPTRCYIFKNNGNFVFSLLTTIGAYSGSYWGDYNNDGKLDFINTGGGHDGDMGVYGGTEYYRNIGNNNFIPDIDLYDEDGYDAKWADIDNDGDLDISISDYNYIFNIYSNTTSTINLPPNAPTNLTTTTNGNDLILQWDKPTDDHNPSSSLSYNVYFGTSDSLTKIISPMSELSNGVRKLSGLGNAGMNNFYILKNLPDGQYVWGVQAIDHSFKGSAFSVCDTIDFVTNNPKLQTSNLKFKVFPNPIISGNDFTIYCSETNTNSVIEIYNITGELICSQPAQTNRTKIITANFGKGVFWVKVKNSEGLISLEKLIIL